MAASMFIDDHDLNPDYLELIVSWLDTELDKLDPSVYPHTPHPTPPPFTLPPAPYTLHPTPFPDSAAHTYDGVGLSLPDPRRF